MAMNAGLVYCCKTSFVTSIVGNGMNYVGLVKNTLIILDITPPLFQVTSFLQLIFDCIFYVSSLDDMCNVLLMC